MKKFLFILILVGTSNVLSASYNSPRETCGSKPIAPSNVYSDLDVGKYIAKTISYENCKTRNVQRELIRAIKGK